MSVFLPESLDEALEVLDRVPDAQLLAGGTDFMVEVNASHRRPPAIVALSQVPELRGWHIDGRHVVLGAGTTYTEMMCTELAGLLPGLAQAARTVGSPQIRNAGTIGGNLGTASPAGDTLPILAALDAGIVIDGQAGTTRTVSLSEFITGPKMTSLGLGEIISAVRIPLLDAAQEFLKVGTRNAMVLAVASVALVVDWAGHDVRIALGSAGPTPIRATEAEQLAISLIDWEQRRLVATTSERDGFVSLVRGAARPIDDHRSTAAYRRHAIGICAGRALGRVLLHEVSEEAS